MEKMHQPERNTPASLRILLSRYRDGSLGEVLEDWKWIFGFSARYKGAIVFYVLLGIVGTTMGLVSSVAGKYMIDIITGYQMEKLWAVAVIMVGSAAFSLAFDSLVSRISAKLSVRIHNDIQADIFDRIMDADWLALSGFSSGDILNRFNGDISTVSSNAIGWLPNVLINIYRVAATFFVILHYDWVMALIALGFTPILAILSRTVMRKLREHNRKLRERTSELMGFEVETMSNMDTIKSFGTTRLYGQKLRRLQEKFRVDTLNYNRFSIATNVLLNGMGSLAQFVTFGYCLFRLWTHQISYGTMTLFMQQRSSFSTAFNNMVSVIPAFLSASVSAHRIRELVDLPKEIHIPESSDLDPLADRGFAVEMEHMTFGYTPDKPVLQQSDFLAQPGEIVALVGPSGQGKTTMIRLILGLVTPGEGSVRIRTAEGGTCPVNAETRHLFAYVPQGNTLLSGSVAENLRMVKEDATEEEMIAALQTACAWDFVSAMPQGIYSPVGERGRGLSEGQAQRVAIARAILRDAPVLLLDEATSALDVATERRVLKNIIREKPNKTCIVTTHRPSVLGMCSRVYGVSEKQVRQLSREESSRLAMDY